MIAYVSWKRLVNVLEYSYTNMTDDEFHEELAIITMMGPEGAWRNAMHNLIYSNKQTMGPVTKSSHKITVEILTKLVRGSSQ